MFYYTYIHILYYYIGYFLFKIELLVVINIISISGGAKNKHSFKNDAKVMAEQIAKLKKSKDSYAQRLKKALKLTENSTFLKALKSFSTMATIFTLLQFREIKKPKTARRFTEEEKIMALSLYKQGPRAYRWFSKVFVLPYIYDTHSFNNQSSIKTGYQ